MLNYQLHLMQEPNGQIVFIQLETNNNVDHAGHLLELKFYQIDYVLLQMEKLMKSYLLNI